MEKLKLKKISLQKKPKKIKKPNKFVGKGLKIVDEDTFSTGFQPASESDNESVEDLPQIADVVDERPVEVQLLESFNKGKWKRLDEDEEKRISERVEKLRSNEDLSPPRKRNDQSPKNFSKRDNDDLSPPRRRRDRSPGDVVSTRRRNTRVREKKRSSNSSNDDMSPPRRRERSPQPSQAARRGRNRSDDDMSPPRRRGKSPKPSQTARRGRNQSDDDMSPPRRRERSPKPVQSTRRQINRSDDDMSPPRRRERSPKPVQSTRRQINRSDDDMSPPRRRERSPQPSQAARRGRNRSDDDMSPPRRRDRSPRDFSDNRRPKNRSDDLSPPRRRDRSPRDPSANRRHRNRSNDLSPPRRRDKSQDTSYSAKRNRADDVSPPRRRNRSPHGVESERRERNFARPEIIDDSEDQKIKKTLDGKKAGLQKATALRDEMLEFRKRELEMFETLPDEVSGRNAVAVRRDRRTEEDLAKEAEKERKEAERKEQYNKWGKGLKQVEEQAERVRSAIHEINKPLARYKDDDDLDVHLKSIDREGDPMLEYLVAKRRKAKGVPERPQYNGPPPPPNRFKILPGFRWDGVDRSNGYEKQWFNRINAKKALEEEAYKWSVEDL